MSTESTRQALDAYLNALTSFGDFGRHMTDDVTVAFMGTDRMVTGRAAAEQLITFVHAHAFKTAVQIKGVACGDGHAMLEAEFVGTHIGEFEGVPASNRHVRVPYAAAYDIEGDRIRTLRLYFPLEQLMRQIRGVEEPATAAV